MFSRLQQLLVLVYKSYPGRHDIILYTDELKMGGDMDVFEDMGVALNSTCLKLQVFKSDLNDDY